MLYFLRKQKYLKCYFTVWSLKINFVLEQKNSKYFSKFSKKSNNEILIKKKKYMKNFLSAVTNFATASLWKTGYFLLFQFSVSKIIISLVTLWGLWDNTHITIHIKVKGCMLSWICYSCSQKSDTLFDISNGRKTTLFLEVGQCWLNTISEVSTVS